MTYQVWWIQSDGDVEKPVSRPDLTLVEAKNLQRRLYALRDLHGDERIAYDADFEIR